jgi:hypothetical protein
MAEIKSLKPPGPKAPPLWTLFLDGTSPPAFSYTRIVGFMVITVFLFLAAFISITSGTLIVLTKEWVYVLCAFALIKPFQRFAEAKDNETQLNYEFQMAQLSQIGLAGFPPTQPPPPIPQPQPQPFPQPPFPPHPQPFPEPIPSVPTWIPPQPTDVHLTGSILHMGENVVQIP